MPSPTFTLVQTYELPRFPLVHADLYRLSGTAELAELGFDDLPDGAVVLLEWPDRAAGLLPPDRLDITFTLAPQLGAEARHVRYVGYGAFAPRAERIALVRAFLDESGFGAARRQRMQGDASTRIFERLTLDDQTMILMNAPPRPDGPPVRDGKPYSAIAHLAEDIDPLCRAGARPARPQSVGAGQSCTPISTRGLIIMEDLGDERIVAGDPPAPIEARYEAAVDVLVVAASPQIAGDACRSRRISTIACRATTSDAFLIEAELLLDWYLPSVGAAADRRPRATPSPRCGATRCGRRSKRRRPGCCAIIIRPICSGCRPRGHRPHRRARFPGRRDRPRGLRRRLAPAGCARRRAGSAGGGAAQPLRRARAARTMQNFDAAGFTQLYATLAAQRATKILGIFARLDRRDGKPQYLRHMPRIWSYLQRSLAHPALAPLQGWYATNVPARDGYDAGESGRWLAGQAR